MRSENKQKYRSQNYLAQQYLGFLCDYHIHSRHSPEEECTSTFRQIIEKAVSVGVRRLGISDHLHANLSVPALEASRAEFDEVIVDFNKKFPGVSFHFGVEVSCLREWDLTENEKLGENGSLYGVQEGGPWKDTPLAIYLPKELKEKLKFEYVIGGAHRPLGAPARQKAVIRSYHRQNMFLANHPDVDIVAHPWWWRGCYWENNLGLPWLADFSVIDDSLHREFAEAVAKNHKAVEINAVAILLNKKYPKSFASEYLTYLEKLKDWGVRFSIGSDAHKLPDVGASLNVIDSLKQIGITPKMLWHPTHDPYQ